MILAWKGSADVNIPAEIKCDICGVVFDDDLELSEFVCFDFCTGEGSTLSKNMRVKFDVCQDCFQDAFSDYFLRSAEVEIENTEQSNAIGE